MQNSLPVVSKAREVRGWLAVAAILLGVAASTWLVGCKHGDSEAKARENADAVRRRAVVDGLAAKFGARTDWGKQLKGYGDNYTEDIRRALVGPRGSPVVVTAFVGDIWLVPMSVPTSEMGATEGEPRYVVRFLLLDPETLTDLDLELTCDAPIAERLLARDSRQQVVTLVAKVTGVRRSACVVIHGEGEDAQSELDLSGGFVATGRCLDFMEHP